MFLGPQTLVCISNYLPTLRYVLVKKIPVMTEHCKDIHPLTLQVCAHTKIASTMTSLIDIIDPTFVGIFLIKLYSLSIIIVHVAETWWFFEVKREIRLKEGGMKKVRT